MKCKHHKQEPTRPRASVPRGQVPSRRVQGIQFWCPQMPRWCWGLGCYGSDRGRHSDLTVMTHCHHCWPVSPWWKEGKYYKPYKFWVTFSGNILWNTNIVFGYLKVKFLTVFYTKFWGFTFALVCTRLGDYILILWGQQQQQKQLTIQSFEGLTLTWVCKVFYQMSNIPAFSSSFNFIITLQRHECTNQKGEIQTWQSHCKHSMKLSTPWSWHSWHIPENSKHYIAWEN